MLLLNNVTGEYFASNSIESEIKRITNIFREDQKFIIHTKFYPDDDPIDGYRDGYERTKELQLKQAVERLVENIYENISMTQRIDSFQKRVEYVNHTVFCLQTVTNAKEFLELFTESCVYEDQSYCSEKIYLAEAFHRMQKDKNRQRLENAASNFMQKHGLRLITTYKAMRILHDEIESANSRRNDFFSGEQRAERYGAYAMSGCRYTFWEDEDYSRNEFDLESDKLYSLLGYIRDYFPLFWAEYQNTSEEDREHLENEEHMIY